MKSARIRINGINDVQRFVMAATMVEGDVLVRKGVHAVDGKSLLGMFSIDPSAGVTVEYPETAADFENFMNEFVIG